MRERLLPWLFSRGFGSILSRWSECLPPVLTLDGLERSPSDLLPMMLFAESLSDSSRLVALVVLSVFLLSSCS